MQHSKVHIALKKKIAQLPLTEGEQNTQQSSNFFKKQMRNAFKISKLILGKFKMQHSKVHIALKPQEI
jgi:hypothetical protein